MSPGQPPDRLASRSSLAWDNTTYMEPTAFTTTSPRSADRSSTSPAAGASATGETAIQETQYVCFMLSGGEYGVDISLVGEIQTTTMEPTPVPQSPFFVEGVIDLRGDIIPIIDLKKRFNLKPLDDKPPTRILVIKMTDVIVGFLVDSVTEVIRVNKTAIQDAPGKIVGIDKEYIWGVTKRSPESHLIMLLDVERILRVDHEDVAGDVAEMA
jgi:purine-binding chemotaxis protein CheW